jgi:glycosyltransferase 2 family protein
MSRYLQNTKRWLPGTFVSFLLIVIIVYFVDFKQMAAAIRSANYRLLALALPLSFIWLAVRGIVWRILLRRRASYAEVFLTLGEGYLLNNFLPFRLGEIGRAFLLSRKTDLQFMEILPTIVIERAVDLAYTAVIFLAALPFVVGSSGAEQVGLVVGIIVLAGLVMLYILARNREWAMQTFNNLSARWMPLQRVDGNFLEAFFEGLAVLTNGWLFARFLFWMTINWALAILAYYLIILAFFPDSRIVWGMFGLGAAAFGGAIPSLPGGVGTFEGAFGGALTLLSGDQSTALATALTARLYNYLSATVIGVIGLSREGQTLSSVYRQLREFRGKNKES